MHKYKTGVCLMALFVVASVFAFGGEKAEVNGMITARTVETLIVTSSARNVIVVLTHV